MHQIKTLVDVIKAERMSYHWVNVDFTIHVPVNDLRYICSASGTAEGRTAPGAAGNQLKWSRGDFLSGTCNTDDDRFTPTFVAAFQCVTHDFGVADTFKGIIGTAFGQIHQVRDKITFNFGWIDEMRHAEFFAPFLLGIVHIHANNHLGASKAEPLYNIQADTAQAKYDGAASNLGFRRIDDSANARCYTAADITDLVERRIRADFGQGNFR